jgi:hypothetical protein
MGVRPQPGPRQRRGCAEADTAPKIVCRIFPKKAFLVNERIFAGSAVRVDRGRAASLSARKTKRYPGTSDPTMPIRPEYRVYYGRQWRAYRAVLLALRGEKCSACGRTVPKYLNLAHKTHDPLTSSVAFLCVACPYQGRRTAPARCVATQPRAAAWPDVAASGAGVRGFAGLAHSARGVRSRRSGGAGNVVFVKRQHGPTAHDAARSRFRRAVTGPVPRIVHHKRGYVGQNPTGLKGE